MGAGPDLKMILGTCSNCILNFTLLSQSAQNPPILLLSSSTIGVEMDHVFGSRWLIDEMSRLGFSISYDEVNWYKQSVIQSESFDNLLTEYFPGTFTQWVADNVDHNVASLEKWFPLQGERGRSS